MKASTKPLFIPLYTEHFNAFESGTKAPGTLIGEDGKEIKYQTEYRLYGPRWNEMTCTIGRKATLSHGYGKKRRLHGVVVGFEISWEPTRTKAWRECYSGKDSSGAAACIMIKLDTGE